MDSDSSLQVENTKGNGKGKNKTPDGTPRLPPKNPLDLVTEENMFEQCKKTHAILMGKLASLDTDTAIASKGKMFGEAVKKGEQGCVW